MCIRDRHIYSSDPEVIQYGLMRMQVICTVYFLCGMMDVLVGSLRGLNYSVLPMIVSLAGACGLRIVWIFTIFQWHRSIAVYKRQIIGNPRPSFKKPGLFSFNSS